MYPQGSSSPWTHQESRSRFFSSPSSFFFSLSARRHSVDIVELTQCTLLVLVLIISPAKNPPFARCTSSSQAKHRARSLALLLGHFSFRTVAGGPIQVHVHIQTLLSAESESLLVFPSCEDSSYIQVITAGQCFWWLCHLAPGLSDWTLPTGTCTCIGFSKQVAGTVFPILAMHSNQAAKH